MNDGEFEVNKMNRKSWKVHVSNGVMDADFKADQLNGLCCIDSVCEVVCVLITVNELPLLSHSDNVGM